MSLGPRRLQRLSMNTIAMSRRTLIQLAREVHRSDPDDIDYPKARLLLEYMKVVLAFWRLEKDAALEERLRRVEMVLENQQVDPIQKEWERIGAGIKKASTDSG